MEKYKNNKSYHDHGKCWTSDVYLVDAISCTGCCVSAYDALTDDHGKCWTGDVYLVDAISYTGCCVPAYDALTDS